MSIVRRPVDSPPRALAAIAALLAAATLAPAPAAAADPVQADYSRTPLLFIHGYFVVSRAGDATWTNFKKRAIEQGWPEEYIRTPSFQDVRGCNEDHVNEIDAWVEELRAKTGSDKVDIVCHSFGCLNTLSWLKERCGVNRVRQMVSLAGAVHGTWIACADDLVGLSCAGHQMCIGMGEGAWQENPLLVEKNACDETPGDVGYTVVWSTYDEIIRPPSGSQMAGARNIEVETDWVEHGGIFLCDECWQHVYDALMGPGGLNEDGPNWDCLAPECWPPWVADPLPEVVEAAEPLPEPSPEPVPEPVVEAAVETAPEVAEVADAAEPAPEPVPDRGTADVPPAPDAVDVATDPGTADADVPLPPRKSGGCSAFL